MAVTRAITEEYTRKYNLSIFVFSHSQLYENKWSEFVIATITKSRVQVGSMTSQHYQVSAMHTTCWSSSYSSSTCSKERTGN